MYNVVMQSIQGLFFRDFENAYFPEILKEMYRDKVYEPYLHDKKDLVMMDLGANVGLFTFYAYKYAKTIYSVEPSASHFEELTTMLTYNKMDRAVPLKLAVSYKDGEETFYHNENSTMFSLKAEVNGLPSESEVVKTATLTTIFKENKIDHIDFMKLDVEGSEYQIVAGDEFAKVAPKIGTIIGEFHSWSNVNPHQFSSALIDNGFEFKWLNATEASLFSAIHK